MDANKPKKEKRLSKKEIDLIRVRYEATAKSNSQIAREFNVLEGAIRYLAKKHNWKKNNELQAYYETEKLINKEEVLTKFKFEKKEKKDLKEIKFIAQKEGEELAIQEIEIQKIKQEMMYKAFKVANKILNHANSLMEAKEIFEYKTEDVFYKGEKLQEVKRNTIKKEFTPHDIEKLSSIIRPFLETEGFLHKPIVELQNNIQNNVNITKNIDNDFEQFSEIAIENGAKKAEALQLASQVYNDIKDVNSA